jgi:hypothetical protein
LRKIAKPILVPPLQKEPFQMPVTIATEQGVPTARLRRTAYVFLRFRIFDFLLAVWAVIVLLIGAHARFGGRLLSIIDQVLMTNAQIAYRNGDPPYFGL